LLYDPYLQILTHNPPFTTSKADVSQRHPASPKDCGTSGF